MPWLHKQLVLSNRAETSTQQNASQYFSILKEENFRSIQKLKNQNYIFFWSETRKNSQNLEAKISKKAKDLWRLSKAL